MTLARVIAQTEPAHAKTPIKSPRPTTQRAAIVFAHFEFIRPFGLDAKTCLGQWDSPLRLTDERHAHQFEQGPAFLIRFGRGGDGNRHTAGFFHFVGVDFRENDLLPQAQ